MSYDHWKTTNPADSRLGRANGKPVAYACLECSWRGNGSLSRADHYNATGHRTTTATDPRVAAQRATRRTA